MTPSLPLQQKITIILPTYVYNRLVRAKPPECSPNGFWLGLLTKGYFAFVQEAQEEGDTKNLASPPRSGDPRLL